MDVKRCPKCKETKAKTDFRKNRSSYDGLDSYCKPCRKSITNPDYHKTYYQENKEQSDLKKREWAERNKEHVQVQRKQRYEEKREDLLSEKKDYYKKNREKILEYKSAYQKIHRHKKNAVEAKRHTSKLQRTPSWLTQDHLDAIEYFYWLSRDLYLSTGEKYNVDHIVPLQGKNVCGLHVPWNLQVLPSDLNIAKGNKYNDW